MYNTVKELHIAIELELQHINTNRKVSFRPEHFDYVLNTSILDYINDKVQPTPSNMGVGFEDNQRRIDELRELKRKKTLSFYTDNSERSFIILPINYYRLVNGATVINLHYNKRTLTKNNTNVTVYINTTDFSVDAIKDVLTTQAFTFTIGGDSFEYSKTTKRTSDGRFDFINSVLEYFNANDNDYELYWEHYNGVYYPDQFICVSVEADRALSISDEGDAYIPTLDQTLTQVYQTISSNGNRINSPIDLVSSEDIRYILSNTTMTNNRHKRPICELSTSKLYCYFNSQFNPISIELAYLRKPTLINYYTNTMCELTIVPEIINRATDKLKVYIKDEQAYNMFLNQVNKNQ